jgi:hypothetical protein
MAATTTAAHRAEISRQNGRKSRGPKSPEAKSRTRWNALKHGMTARYHVLPDEDPDAFRRLVDSFIEALSPAHAVELALTEQAAIAHWRIQRAARAEAARVASALRAAEAAAGHENHEEVAAMGHWLLAGDLRARQEAGKALFPFLSADRHDSFGRGRGDPRHIVSRLEATAEGCGWLFDQWAKLRVWLERGVDWRTNELIAALQLRGLRPLGLDIIDWGGLTEPILPKGRPEAIAEARSRMLSQFDEDLAEDPAGQRAELLGWVQEEMERLGRRKAAHEKREAADRAELPARLAVDTSAEGDRMRRFQADCDRKMDRAINTLLKLRRGDATASVPEPDAPDPGPWGSVRPATDGADGPAAEPEPPAAPAEPPSSGDLDAPARCYWEPDHPIVPQAECSESDHPVVPQNEPSPTVDDVRVSQNEPARPAVGAPIWQDEPSPLATADRIPQNEPSPPAYGDRIPQNEPTAPGRIAALAVPGLVFALLILLAAGLSAAFAGALAGPAGQADLPREERSQPAATGGSTDLRGPWEFPFVGSPQRARIWWDGEFHAETRGIEEFHAETQRAAETQRGHQVRISWHPILFPSLRLCGPLRLCVKSGREVDRRGPARAAPARQRPSLRSTPAPARLAAGRDPTDFTRPTAGSRSVGSGGGRSGNAVASWISRGIASRLTLG